VGPRGREGAQGEGAARQDRQTTSDSKVTANPQPGKLGERGGEGWGMEEQEKEWCGSLLHGLF
jgi:hypothetical protein